ncbi:MAG: hypothetical protein ACTHPD_16025 [Rhizomicrobium sp.]
MVRLQIVAVALVFLCVAPAIAADAPNRMLGFGANLKPDERALLMQAVQQALNQVKAGASADWSDDKTGRAGRATVLRVYEKSGAPCGAVEHVFTKGGGDRYELPFCRQPDGTWKISF